MGVGAGFIHEDARHCFSTIGLISHTCNAEIGYPRVFACQSVFHKGYISTSQATM